MSEPIRLYRPGQQTTVYAPSEARRLEGEGWSRTPPDAETTNKFWDAQIESEQFQIRAASDAVEPPPTPPAQPGPVEPGNTEPGTVEEPDDGVGDGDDGDEVEDGEEMTAGKAGKKGKK